MPLVLAPFNQELTITHVGAEGDVRRHLQEMGITIGTKVTVISSTGGNLILMIYEGRVGLDRTLASKILVA